MEDKDLLLRLLDTRNAAIKKYESYKKQDDFLSGYWHGYFNAINDILETTLTEEELKEYYGMGFD